MPKNSRDYKNEAARIRSINAEPPKRNLTPKETKFVAGILGGLTPIQACKQAGVAYPRVEAMKYLNRPHVAAEINARRMNIEHRVNMSQDKIVAMFLESYEMAKTIEDPSTMTRATAELGRMLGYYEPQKVELNIDIRETKSYKELDALPDDVLAQMAELEFDDALEGDYELLPSAKETGNGPQ